MIQIPTLPLTEFETSKYSQWGEDGVISELLRRTGCSYREEFCIDVGAWDGEYLSNTRALIDQGMKALLIEADPDRAKLAAKKFSNNDRVVIINEFVDDTRLLDSLVPAPWKDVRCALVSIDIDSDDLQVFQNLGALRPRIVIIEFNPTVPNHVSYKNLPGSRVGNSAKAIIDDSASIGYALVHATSTNLFLLENECCDFASTIRLEITDALDDSATTLAVFTGYDGSLQITGNSQVEFVWHGLSRNLKSLSLPKSLQHHTEDYGAWQKILYRYLWFRQYWRIALKRRMLLLKEMVNKQVT